MTGCFGFCEKGSIVKVMPDTTFYTQVTPADVAEIVSEHNKGKKGVPPLYSDPNADKHISD